GRTWEPTEHERQTFSDIRALVSNPWTVLHTGAPVETKANGDRAVDLPEKIGAYSKNFGPAGDPLTTPAWHGTILPETDADLWLASAFAEFERMAAMERQFRDEGGLNPGQRLRLGLERNGWRSSAAGTLGANERINLSAIRKNTTSDAWHRQATGKGVLVMHELRRMLTAQVFDKA